MFNDVKGQNLTDVEIARNLSDDELKQIYKDFSEWISRCDGVVPPDAFIRELTVRMYGDRVFALDMESCANVCFRECTRRWIESAAGQMYV